ncbi:expressed unknown protein [Seminavis robusta]|uniref:Uncharacterized protein n=1 Tax=Seminavis robusta TaxID=568900 RepID=A0A9N8DD66_9STRA|nr:expressed unknown protein [Seminavis robusta]|eukprot:Sro40_g024850.1 n/a (544) ;mRNA; f:117422-119053
MASFLARPCSGSFQYNKLVNHYFSWVLISDVVGIFLPPKRRHWVNLFRVSESFVFVYTTITLHFLELEEPRLAFQFRLGVSLVRLIHAAFLLYKYKTSLVQLWALPSCLRDIFQSEFVLEGTEYVFYGFVPFFLGSMLLPNLLYLSHYNYDVASLDAILTHMQGSESVNVHFKKLIFLILIPSARNRAVASWFVFGAFSIQWVIMLPMFALAPIPYMHIVAEIVFLMEAVLLTREWWHQKSETGKLKDSNHESEELATIESDLPLVGFDWGFTILIEVANMASCLARPSAGDFQYNKLVNHYISWQLITDVPGLLLPPKRRHWVNLFRALESLVLLYTTIYLKVQNLEKPGLAFQTRLGVSVVRLIHASSLLYKYKTSWAQIWALPGWLRAMIQSDFVLEATQGVAHISITFFLGSILLPHLFYISHFNYQVASLDAILTNLQAGFCVNVQLKKLLYLMLMNSAMNRAGASWFTFGGFAIQWVIMLPMFVLAPIPYIHIVAEIAFLIDALLLTREWQHHKQNTKLKDSNHGFDEQVPLSSTDK